MQSLLLVLSSHVRSRKLSHLSLTNERYVDFILLFVMSDLLNKLSLETLFQKKKKKKNLIYKSSKFPQS